MRIQQIRKPLVALAFVSGCLTQANGQAVLDYFTSMRSNVYAPGGVLWPINTLNLPMTTSARAGLLTATSGAIPITSIVVSNDVATVTTASANPYYPYASGYTTVIQGATIQPSLNGLYEISSAGDSTTFVIPTTGVANGTYTESGLVAAGSFFYFFLPINASPYAYTTPCTAPGCTYAQAFIQGGEWSANYNRLSFQIKCNSFFPRNVGGSDGVFQFGTYIRQENETATNNQGIHYYHYSDLQIYPNVWTYMILNRVPSHCNICTPYDKFQDDPEWWEPQQSNGVIPAGVHYWDGLVETYVDGHYGGIANTACQVTPYTFSLVNGEPDSHINTFASTYNGSAYEVNFNTPSMVSGGEHYSVSSSTKGSLHVNGFSSGTLSSVTGYSSNPYLNALWTSAPMAQAPTLWVAFRPAMPIQGVTGNGVSPIVVTSIVNPNLATGDQVTIANVTGNSAANGTWTVTERPGQDFRFWDGTLVSIVVTSNLATATTSSPHGLQAGQIIAPKSMVIGGGNLQNYNEAGVGVGVPVNAVPSSTTFQFATNGVPDGAYTIASDNQAYIFSFFSTSLNGSTGNGAYTGGGTMTATSNTTNFAEAIISSLCDLNSDGVYDGADVSLEINQALGLIGCQNDVDGDGRCTVVDVQRVINAASTGTCLVGP